MSCCCHAGGQSPTNGTSSESSVFSTLWLKIGGAIVIAGLGMIFSLGVNISPPPEPTRTLIHLALALSVLVVVGLIGLPLLQESWRQLASRRFGVELLFLCGIAGAFFSSLFSTFSGTGDVYYEVVAILLVIYVTGKTIGAVQKTKAISALDAMDREFQSARRPNGDIVSATEIAVGDRVEVLPGEPIPIDGVVVKGTAFINEAHLTGEPFSVVRREHDPVRAGSRCLDAPLTLEATRPGSEREWDRLLEQLKQARYSKSHLQAQADRITAWFLPAVLSLSTGTFLFWLWADHWEAALFNALAVLVVACPCALGLATPIAVWSTLHRLLDAGLRCRTAEFIERMATIDTLLFDKTGTLSESRPQLVDFTVRDPDRREAIMERIAALEHRHPHPFARLFAGWSQGSAPDRDEPIPGTGLRGTWGESTLEIGNRELLTPDDHNLLDPLRRKTGSPDEGRELYVREDGKLAGLIRYRETLREPASKTLSRLRECGLELACCTGDRKENLAALDLPSNLTVHASLSPEGKLDLIRELQASGKKVGLVGDGANDAAAMEAADLAIAMESAHGLATEAAHGELVGDRLDHLPEIRDVCRETVKRLRQNLIFATGYNVIGISLAMVGILHPVHAALLMLASSATVSWRALQHAEKAWDRQKAAASDTPMPTQRTESPEKGSCCTAGIL